MKVAALAILTVLIALPAEAVQRQNTFSPSCDNDGHCTTSNVTASTASQTPSLRARLIAHQSVKRATSSMPMATACW